MINYANQEVKYNGCPGCAFANHEFTLPCGMAYENERFTLAQDWELPIQGFFVLSPKRCIEKFSELTEQERIEAYELINKTITILRENNICDRFNVLFEEKANRHFHIWIMPRHQWMEEVAEDHIDHIGKIFAYAKENFRTDDNYEKINKISAIVKNNIQ